MSYFLPTCAPMPCVLWPRGHCHLRPSGSTQRHLERMVRLPGAPRSPTASRPCGIGLDLSLAGLGVWTLARPAAWQHPSLAARRWSEFFHFSAGLASLEQTWPRPAPAPGSGADSDLDMLATEFVWCPGDERMCKFPPRPAPPPPLSRSACPVPLPFPACAPCRLGPRAAPSLGSSEQLAWSGARQARTDANPVAST